MISMMPMPRASRRAEDRREYGVDPSLCLFISISSFAPCRSDPAEVSAGALCCRPPARAGGLCGQAERGRDADVPEGHRVERTLNLVPALVLLCPCGRYPKPWDATRSECPSLISPFRVPVSNAPASENVTNVAKLWLNGSLGLGCRGPRAGIMTLKRAVKPQVHARPMPLRTAAFTLPVNLERVFQPQIPQISADISMSCRHCPPHPAGDLGIPAK